MLQFIWTPPSLEQLFSLELVAEAKTDCSAPITCPCPQGLTVSQSLRANTSPHWSSDQKQNKKTSGSQAANYCAPQLLRSHTCSLYVALTAGCAVFLRRQRHHQMWCLSGPLQGKWIYFFRFFCLCLCHILYITFSLHLNPFQCKMWHDVSMKRHINKGT